MRHFPLTILLWLGALCISFSVCSQSFKPGVLRVKLKENVASALRLKSNALQFGLREVDQLNQNYGVKKISRVFREAGKFEKAHQQFGLHLWYEIELDENTDLQIALSKYKRFASFETVELCRHYTPVEPLKNAPEILRSTSGAGVVNDPMFHQQWHYKNTGQTGGTTGSDISLEQAWSIQTGDPNVIVAVIDGGIDFQHPDLAQSMWINTAEIPDNDVDDDNNGYTDDIYGYNFGDDTGTIYPDYHGTHVAGTIAAVTNNGTGVSGIAGGSGSSTGARLMSCAGFGKWGTGGFENAMIYAADNGAVISQNSWRGGSDAIEDAIDYFIARAGYDNTEANFDKKIQLGPMAGGIVIFAAGNENSTYGYPASYAPVMAVASTDHNDRKSDFSNYGAFVDIAAPGTAVYSTYPVNLGSYATLSGTSMACPHVSGVAALIISQFGGSSFYPGDVWARLQSTCDNIDTQNPGYEGMLGSGRLNAFSALEINDDIPPGNITDLAVAGSESSSVTLQWTATGGSGSTGAAHQYDIRYATAPITASDFNAALQAEGESRPAASGVQEIFKVEGLTHSTKYYFAIKASDFFGTTSSLSNVVSVSTLQPPAIKVAPASITADLFSGEEHIKTISIGNTGASALEWQIRVTLHDEVASGVFEPTEKSEVTRNNTGQSVSKAISGGPFALAPGDFTLKTPSPKALTCLAADPSSGKIYGQANNGVSFYRYDPAEDNWVALRDAPLTSGNNGGAVFLDGKLYTTYTNNPSMLGIYDPETDTWTTLSNGLGMGTGNIATDGDYIYLVTGNMFKRYHPASGSWTNLPHPPFLFEPWGGLSVHQNIIYGHQGNGFTGFAKYDIINETWTSLPAVPGGAVLGCAIDQRNEVYYAYGAYAGNLWYAYDMKENSWSIKNIPFWSVNDGGIVYVRSGAGKGIYFSQGETGSGWAHYEPETFTWIIPDERSGRILPGETKAIDLTFDAGDLSTGNYEATLHVLHNDPVKETIDIPVVMSVTSAPHIVLSTKSLDFGEIYTTLKDSLTITVTNSGTGILSVGSMTTSNSQFSVSELPFNLDPGEQKSLQIVFKPATTGYQMGILTLASNDPDEPSVTVNLEGEGILSGIGISKTNLDAVLMMGLSEDQPLTITNTGGTAYQWKISAEDENNGELTVLQQDLEDEYTSITSIIPALYNFSNGTTGYYIADGGNDMYDVGNYMITDAGSNLLYSDRSIREDESLGTGGKYFTAKYPGLFVFAADVAISSFSINGRLGADGWGKADGTVLTVTRGSKTYKGFVKRVYNTSDPSVNHLIIAEDNGLVNHSFPSDTDEDLHNVSNLNGVPRIYYLLFAGREGTYINDEVMLSVMNAFLNIAGEDISWLKFSKKTGTLLPGAAETIQVTFDTRDLLSGEYNTNVLISSNASRPDSLSIPAKLKILGRPAISVSHTTLNFPKTHTGGYSEQSIMVQNNGNGSLDIHDIRSNHPSFSVSSTSLTLDPGEHASLLIRYNPTAAGDEVGTLALKSNDPDHPLLTLSLSGKAVLAPLALLNPVSINRVLFKGNFTNENIVLKNTGGDVMHWTISPTLPSWAQLDQTSGSLEPSRQQSLRLNLDTKDLDAGEYSFDITMRYNHPVDSTVIFNVLIKVTENHSPYVTAAIPDQTLSLYDDPVLLNLASYIDDEDNESLLYTVEAPDNNASFEITGSQLSIAPRAIGNTLVTIKAEDHQHTVVSTQFEVVVTTATGIEKQEFIKDLKNTPNPFNGQTLISYTLKERGYVQVQLQDISGRVVETLVNTMQIPGNHEVLYQGGNLGSGVYLYRIIKDGKLIAVGKMMRQ